MKKKKIIVATILVVIVAGVLVSWILFGKNKESIPKYKKEAVSRGDIEALVVTSGTLNPVTLVEVGSQVTGKIAKLYADFNSRVKAGQVVAELDQSLYLTKVKQAEANYQSSLASLERAKVDFEQAKKKYERALSLFEKNLISIEEKDASEAQYLGSKTELQSAQARLEQAKSQLDSSRVDLTYTVIRSPIDGIVITRNVNEGQTVAAGMQAPVLFKVARDLSKMQVECSVDEADIGKVKEGQNVRFTVDAFPEENFKGVVTQVRYSPEIIQNVVTYTTIVNVDNPEMKLRPGMTATVSIIVGEARNVLRVPNSALRFTPPLSAQELEAIMKSAREEMMAKRQGSSPDANPAQGQTQSPQARFQRPEGRMQELSPEARQKLQAAMRRRQMAQVWIEDKNSKLKLVFIRTGVTDNTYTEVIGEELQEGQLVITGLAQATGSSASRQTTPGPGPGMFMMRR